MNNDIEIQKSISNCINNGIFIYPVYFENEKNNGKTIYKSNNWYIQVNNNGKLKTYNKSIGTGKTLSSHTKKTKYKGSKLNPWGDTINKLYVHWNSLIKKQDESDKRN